MNTAQEIHNIEEEVGEDKLKEIAIGVVQNMFKLSDGLNKAGLNIDDIKFNIRFLRPGMDGRRPNADLQYMNQGIKQGHKIMPKSSPEELKAKKASDEKFSDAVDKRELINVLTQGTALNIQKDMLQYDEETSDISDNLPTDLLAKYFSFLRTSLDATTTVPDSERKRGLENGMTMQVGRMDVKSNEDDSYTVNVAGINLIVVIQEMVKGIYEILSYHGLGEYDKEMLHQVFDETDNMYSEQQGFIFGPIVVQIYSKFFHELESQLIKEGFMYEYNPAMKGALLAYTYSNLPDKEFLNLFARIFNAEDDDSIRPFAEFKEMYKTVYKSTSGIEDQNRETDYDDETDADDIVYNNDFEPITDYSKLSQAQLQQIQDVALENDDFETMRKVSAYIK